jgi:hypothetical protein
MIEKKFRAKNIETGKWIYFDLGYLWHCSKQWLKIDWNTVCQYIGHKDAEGNDIYEGDIVFAEDGWGKHTEAIKLTTLPPFDGNVSPKDVHIVSNIYNTKGDKYE